MLAQTKPCGKCLRDLPTEHFYKDRSRKSGYGSYCKSCDQARSRRKRDLPSIDLSAAELRQIYEYRAEEGGLVRTSGAAASTIVGSLRYDGYLTTRAGRKALYVHRVIWQIHHGEIPQGLRIDHINGNRTDNRIENLRTVSITDNNRNAKLQHLNRSGIHGVYFLKKSSSFRVTIGVDGKCLTLGHFKCFLDAAAARKSAELRYGFHPNHGRSA